MRIMIGIGHPKQVHIWKNVIKILISDGHEIKIIASDKDITRYLLDTYGFNYDLLPNYTTFAKKALGLFSGTIEMTKIAKKFNPDILISGTPYFVYVAKIFNKPHITFSDTEHVGINKWLTYPFTDVICTPSCFRNLINIKKHITFNSYFEMAYLHANYFEPNPSVLNEMGLDKNEKFIIVRFVSWSANHDVGQHGIQNKIKLVYELEKYGKVFITSEGILDKDLEKYKTKILPEKFHDLLYYASLYVGDGGATASEAAILGIPAVYISTIVPGYIYDEEKYGLIHVFSDPKSGEEKGLKKALELLKDSNSKNDAIKGRKKLLEEKIDTTAFIVNLIENYPER